MIVVMNVSSQFKKINIKNIGIDPFDPVVLLINNEYALALERYYSHLIVFMIHNKSDIKKYKYMFQKNTIIERNELFSKIKKGKHFDNIKIFKYYKGDYYSTKNKKIKVDLQVLFT